MFIVQESMDKISAILSGKDHPEANDDTKEALTLLHRLQALTLIHNDIGTWLEAEYFNAHQV